MQKEKFSLINDKAILKELGSRIDNVRINNNLQDQDIVQEGVPVRTLQRAKKGGNITLETFVKILRSLNRLHELERLLETTDISPVDLAKKNKLKTRHRIRKQNKSKTRKEWTWGE